MELFEPDIRWTIFVNCSTKEDFEKTFLPKIELSKTIDQGIQDYYNVTRRLLDFSYYEYEFVTVALRSCLPLIEFSLQHYYFKFNGERFRGNLFKLIKWFGSEEIIDIQVSELLDQIRIIRNHYMHPSTHVVAPPAVIGIISLILEIINHIEEKFIQRV